MQTQPANIHPIQPHLPASQSDLLDGPYLHAIADLADARGAAMFTPGGGALFAKPLSREDRATLPAPQDVKPRFIDLPLDRFKADYARLPAFRQLVDRFTIPHIQNGYRLVVIPLAGRLEAGQLRAIAKAADTFGHGNIRLTADVSIRLTNVPEALLRPLFASLQKVGLLAEDRVKQAA
jgi:nitrite/sulfite reductase ferredoxin-like protein